MKQAVPHVDFYWNISCLLDRLSTGYDRCQGEMEMPTPIKDDIKVKVNETIQTLPEDATWDDVMYRIYVRQKIEQCGKLPSRLCDERLIMEILATCVPT